MKALFCFILIIFISSTIYSFSNRSSNLPYLNLTKKVDSLNVSWAQRFDSLKGVSKKFDQEIHQPYQEILEKTNQQLSLWWNPYALIIASLAVLFTILTLLSAFIIYTQSKEFKDKVDSVLKSYTALLEKLLEDGHSRLSEIDKKAAGYEDRLKNATGEQKALLEEELKALKSERESVSTKMASTVIPVPSTVNSLFSSATTNRYHKCTQCKRGFYISDPGYMSSLRLGSKTVTCPKCGNVDELLYI